MTNGILVVQHFGVMQPSLVCDWRQAVAQKEHGDGEDFVPPLCRAQEGLARPARSCLSRTDQVCDLGAKRRRKRDGRPRRHPGGLELQLSEVSAFITDDENS